mmetsp:Transcript_2746/g.7739  ORF Transcript_2746/g.7739 Transcript_2746/m.7739 type:complete len:521 (+) Transcript_2746:256-1818(+)
MPLFVVLDVAYCHAAARDIVRKTLRRLLKRCPAEEVALLDAADLQEERKGAAPDQHQEQQQHLPGVGSGTEHLTQLLAKLNDEGRWAHPPGSRTWQHLMKTVMDALPAGTKPYDPSRILLVSDTRKDGGLASLLGSGRLSNCCVHTVLLSQQTSGHCPVLSGLASATRGTFSLVTVEEDGKDFKQPKRPIQGKHSFFPMKKPRKAGGKEAQQAAMPGGMEAIAMQAAVNHLGEALSSVQFAELFVGHLSADIRIAPPLPADLRAPELSGNPRPDPAPEEAGKATGKPSAQCAVSMLSVLSVLPAAKLLHPLAKSTHVVCNTSAQRHPLVQLLAIALQGEPRHEPLAAVVAVRGCSSAEESGSECLGLLQLEPGPTEGQAVMLLSILHPAVHSLDWLERIRCQQPMPLIFQDVLEQLTHDILKVQRYARALPSRQQALEQTIAAVKAVIATYSAPGLCSLLGSALQGAHDEMEEKAAQEQRQRRQHNTRRQAAHATGTAQALEILEQALLELEAPPPEAGV